MKNMFSAALGAVLATSVGLSVANASKARVGALQGALGLVDTQTIFTQPAYIHKLNPYVTYEFGSTAVAGTPKGEGGFLMGQDGARWAAYLGHTNPLQTFLRAQGTYQNQDNPVDLFYGMGNWAANIQVSSSEDEQSKTRQSSLSGRFGMDMGAKGEFYGALDLLSNAEKNTTNPKQEFRGAPTISAGYLTRMDKMTVSADIAYADAKYDAAANSSRNMKYTGVALAANHRPIPELYYGASLEYGNLDIEGKKRETISLPVVIGLEKDIVSWLTMRGSVKQGILLGSTRNEIAGTAVQRNLNDTSVAAGLGIKYANFTFDGLLAAATSGAINGSTFLTNASMTYNF